MPRLVNEELSELNEKLKTYKEELSTAVYEQYKTALVLSNTNNLRGNTGDSLKNYINLVHINLTQKIINIASELTEAMNLMEQEFINYENNKSGIVGSGTLGDVKESVQDARNKFDDLHARSGSLLSKASEFIATTSLPVGMVNSSYSSVIRKVNDTKTGLEERDSKVSADLRSVKDRIESLKQQIYDITNGYHGDNGIDYSKVSNIQSEAWYSNEGKAAFNQMLEDDPFRNDAGHASVWEDQWVTGHNQDIFIAADASALSATGSTTVSDGNTRYEGNASALNGTTHGQLTEYATLDGSASILGANGHLEFGDDGLDLSGDVNLAKVEASGMIGNKIFNGHVNASADAFTANGSFVVKPPDDKGDYNYNIGGRVSGASAQVDAGITLLGADALSGEVEENSTGLKEKKSLLGADVSASIGFQAGAEAELSQSTVFESEYLDVEANTVKVDLSLVVGVKLSLSFPTVDLKWPW
ncbi:T7SS effector LXG polymorphic toxin [Oceanobacillus bengalensis]|uniref:LXG domain-containing protein n=1 Tax=Oceanobacillus bengalensis TaxID=1435466 RepID=A0A494Z3G6_9BACI|nr:T7SS effector LXG polymorphic toxin [Oceanobacillus bengalensis]RKQ16844.1 hypothetical protein D8M05_06210 [Oceanobacillus bengalensis]